MSPGMSQKGMRSPKLMPVRAGTWGKSAAVPRAAQPGALPQPFFCDVSARKPASMKAIPVPTEPVSPSDPNPSRTPAPTLPVPAVCAAEPKETPPESAPYAPTNGPSSSRYRGTWTSPGPSAGRGMRSTWSLKCAASSGDLLEGGWPISLQESKERITAGPGPQDWASFPSSSPGRSAPASCRRLSATAVDARARSGGFMLLSPWAMTVRPAQSTVSMPNSL